MNIIYITGLSRSGTTYLSSELVNELGAISIGESIKNIGDHIKLENKANKKEFIKK